MSRVDAVAYYAYLYLCASEEDQKELEEKMLEIIRTPKKDESDKYQYC